MDLPNGEILRFTGEALVRSLGDVCIIRILSPSGDWLYPAVIAHRDAEGLERLRSSPFGYAIRVPGSIHARALEQRRTLVLNADDPNLLRDQPLQAAGLRGIGVTRFAIVPLLHQEAFIGTVGVGSEDPHGEYTPEDVKFLEDAGRIVASAILRASGR